MYAAHTLMVGFGPRYVGKCLTAEQDESALFCPINNAIQ
jgi:hypothetical protein